MSADFELKGCSLDLEDWNDLLIAWTEKQSQPILGPRAENLGDSTYLPQLDRKHDRKILDQLARHAVKS